MCAPAVEGTRPHLGQTCLRQLEMFHLGHHHQMFHTAGTTYKDRAKENTQLKITMDRTASRENLTPHTMVR